MDVIDQEPWADMKDVSSHLGVTAETVRNWIQSKGFPGSKIGGRWRFKMSDVDEWVETSGASSAPIRIGAALRRARPPKLVLGDCLSALKQLPDNSVDLVLTDPPYNLGLFMQERDTNLKRMRENYFGAAGWDDLDFDTWSESMDSFFSEASRVLRKGGSMIVFMAVIKVESLINMAQAHGLYYKTTGTWHKLNPMPRNMNLHFINSTESWIYFTNETRTGTFNNEGKAIHDFIETAVTSKGERAFGSHPTQKPVSLMKHFISLLSNEGDVVLDPFMGSGSTGVAAAMLDRNFIGVELSDKYYSIAQSRIEDVLS